MSANVTNIQEVIVIGAGFAGLATGKRLLDAGITNFVILDRGDTVGGTWRDNTYPGAACDIPSNLYSLSFDLNPNWSKGYPDQHELHAYLQGVAERHGLVPHIRRNVTVTEARWDDDGALWTVTTQDGDVLTSTTVVSAVGFLRDANIPDFPGLSDFKGPILHTAAWDHDVDLTGKRVGVIGSGASAIQVTPEIAKLAKSVTIFQRTPPYVMPRHNRSKTGVERWALGHVPGLQRAVRAATYVQKEGRFVFFVGGIGDRLRPLVTGRALAHMHAAVKDRDLRRQLTPDYPMGCKRVLISDDWYPTLAMDHVTVTGAMHEVTGTAAVDSDGRAHDVDVLVFATGFDVHRPLGELSILGRDGIALAEQWGNKASAYLGTSVPNFPNFFAVIGPNCGLGHNSMVFIAESHLNHVVPAIAHALRDDVAAVEVSQDAHDAFVREMDRRSTSSVWEAGCTSWYLNDEGQNALLWPGSTLEFWYRNRGFEPHRYEIRPTETVQASRALAMI